MILSICLATLEMSDYFYMYMFINHTSKFSEIDCISFWWNSFIKFSKKNKELARACNSPNIKNFVSRTRKRLGFYNDILLKKMLSWLNCVRLG